MSDAIQIRSIQHYMHCPRQFALLALNQDWEENALVVRANLLHEHVHDGTHAFSSPQKVVRSDVAIFLDAEPYNIYGYTDCVEFCRSASGVPIPGLTGTYQVKLVEYKPTAPKSGEQPFHEADAIQVFAQKLCADSVWHCSSEGYLYYANTRKRVRLPFDTQYDVYDAKIRQLLSEMRHILETHQIPARRKGQKCSGCSMSEVCMPKVKPYCVRELIASQKEEMLSCGDC